MVLQNFCMHTEDYLTKDFLLMKKVIATAAYLQYNKLANENKSVLNSLSSMISGTFEVIKGFHFGLNALKKFQCNICGWQGNKF